MKIAIITWTNTSNFGTGLQAYALQAFLRDMGYDVSLIDYKGLCEKRTITEYLKSKKRNMFVKMKHFFFGNNEIYRRKNIHEFLWKNAEFTEPITEEVMLYNLNNEFDCFICGSDQIWNPNNYDSTYFLPFVNKEKIKIAYAPSFGVDEIPKIKHELYKELLRNFSLLSVREKTGINIIEEIVGMTPELFVDPVFLIDRDKWIKFANRISHKDYVYSYFLSKNEKHINCVSDFAKANKSDFICAMPNHVNKQCGNYINVESVGDFLGYIVDATVVFTDSFHVAAFAIIFHKQVYILSRFDDNNRCSQNSRVKNLTEMLGIEKNLLKYNSEKFDVSYIDYEKVDRILQNKINYSRECLLKELKKSRS
ncbi:polysaccharide pyruvyl transferase family protein [Pseudobutyrivibrio sp.]|uniref:polysaccharide pyruvyl transferase family protein n=1 Tax=Pseudobutyrivibrio sp. TaxID=2014367 RepID=UPI001B75FD58|nr:polysaccharide pyruvyl transferase family protein [Pseudobutyrivibrio sp.]MBP3263083.1 polysaccharide pyruvyl transferase family protein [Pseudobutyrivibrio sp.]